MRRHFRQFFRCSFRLEVASDVISGALVGQVGVDGPVKFGDTSSNSGRLMWHFRPFLGETRMRFALLA